MGVEASKGGGTSPLSAVEPLTLTLNDKGALTPLTAASKGVGSGLGTGAPTLDAGAAVDATPGTMAGVVAAGTAGGAAVAGTAVTGIAKA